MSSTPTRPKLVTLPAKHANVLVELLARMWNDNGQPLLQPGEDVAWVELEHAIGIAPGSSTGDAYRDVDDTPPEPDWDRMPGGADYEP